jgi:hypothetical protein
MSPGFPRTGSRIRVLIVLAFMLIVLRLLGAVWGSAVSTSRLGLSKQMKFSSCRTATLSAARSMDRVTWIVGWPPPRRPREINGGLACEHLRTRMAQPRRRLFEDLPASARAFTSGSVKLNTAGIVEIGRSGESRSSSMITPLAGQGRTWVMSKKRYENRRTSPSKAPTQAGASHMMPVASPVAACPSSALKE